MLYNNFKNVYQQSMKLSTAILMVIWVRNLFYRYHSIFIMLLSMNLSGCCITMYLKADLHVAAFYALARIHLQILVK